MKMKMNFSSSISFLLLFLFQLSSITHSQSDSCNSNFNLKGLPFETTSLQCLSVWPAQDYILRYKQSGPEVWSFILSAPNTNSYIGFGFSKDGKMVGSSAIVGWISGNGVGTIQRYFLGAQNPNSVLPNQGSLILVNNSAIIISDSNRLYLGFQLNNTSQPLSKLIYSVGPQNFFPSSDLRLRQHRSQVAVSVNFQSGGGGQVSQLQRPYTKLRRSHGILNMIGWGILLLIGAMVARYLREKDPLWFYLHGCIQLCGFILGVSGVIAGLVLEDVLSAEVDRHKTIGVFVLVLGCLQVMAFLVRPKKEAKLRIYWNWYHFTIGRVLIILAATNVFYGIHLGKEHKGWNAAYGVVLGLLVATAIGLEVRMRMKK